VLQTQTQGSSGTIPGITSVHTDLPGFDSIGSSNYPFAHKRIDTDPLGHVTTYRFDSLNRLTSVTNAESNTRTITYDGINKVSETDFKGQSTGYVYDSLDCTAPLGIGGVSPNSYRTSLYRRTADKNAISSSSHWQAAMIPASPPPLSDQNRLTITIEVMYKLSL